MLRTQYIYLFINSQPLLFDNHTKPYHNFIFISINCATIIGRESVPDFNNVSVL